MLDITLNGPSGFNFNQNYNSNRSNQSKNAMLQNQKEFKNKISGAIAQLGAEEEAFSSKKSNSKKPSQVMGLISQFNELFLFEKKVPYQQNKFECWLQGAETSMQETVGKLINYAVNTFPKQSLDEWILDYPQQVILTTIHLILTHEINELFEEMRKDKEAGENGRDQRNHSDGQGEDSDEGVDYTGATPKTPDTRDLIKNSQISNRHHRTLSQHVSQKSSIRFMKKKEEIGMGAINPKRVSTHEFNKDSSSYQSSTQHKLKNQQQMRHQQYFNNEEHKGPFIMNDAEGADEDEFNESELEALDMSRERKKFAANMFGQDFDINLIADNKDDTMRILQEKSFRGLYLRLQFWINQICKSLYMSKPSSQDWKSVFDRDLSNLNSPETPKLSLELHPVQRLVMQTIINFLSYMRDVVYELKTKKIDNVEDFEWQKQMRLTWNGKDSGCKVDCGAWTTQQANEYFGAQQRIPLTPLTNKYFVFISAAFREKSAVLFRCVPSHDYCGDIFKEFSSICSVPFKDYQCNPKHSMKSLMQFLNGAALASVWIFFEHVDKLDYVHLQTFNKEIQMVQQQFIIAELSQDSSVITAHITVGNQSISQCQRSIERIREQASLESKQNDDKRQNSKGPLKLTNIIGGGADIKIEDNIEIQNYGNFDYEDDEDDDKSIEMIQQDRLPRQASRKDLQLNQQKTSNKGTNEQHQKQILHNLSQLDLEDDEFNNDFQQLEEDNNDDNMQNQDNLGGGQSKMNPPPQNKVCFGVFASLSHTFNLKREKWATEVSTALQSAFRVLSLTKPEMPIITSMLLKSEAGFLNYKILASKTDEVMLKIVREVVQQGDRDDTFSVTVRDLRRLVTCCKAVLDKEILKVSVDKKDQIAQIKNQGKGITTYAMEKKTKSQILRDIEDEDKREQTQKDIKIKLEERVLVYVLQLFLFEKLSSYMSVLKFQEDKIRNQIKELVTQVFGRDSVRESELISNQTINQNQNTTRNQNSVDNQISQVGQYKGLNISNEERNKIKTILNCISQAKPVGIVGKPIIGKTQYLKLASKDILKKNLIFFNSLIVGSYRELYGIYDPFSTTQQFIEQQIGSAKNSLFSVLKNEIEKENNILVIDGDFDIVFNETLLPYLEYQSFKEQQLTQNSDFQSSVIVTLPNGIQESLKDQIPIVYEFRSLENTSPRFVSSLQIVNMKENIELKDYASMMKAKLLKVALKRNFQASQQTLRENINYTIDQIVIPAIHEVKKAKYLSKNSLDIIQVLKWSLQTYESFLKDIKFIGNVEQTLIKVALMTIIFSLGNAIKQDGKNAIEEIFSGMKNSLGIRGSIFNYALDNENLDIAELRPYLLDNDIIINSNLLRANYYARLLLKNGKSLQIVGGHGTQKSTIIRYLLKTHQPEICSKSVRVPLTCFLTHRSLRSLLQQKYQQNILTASAQSEHKPVLLIVEDLSISEENFNFDIIEYLRLVKANKYQVFSNESRDLYQLSNKFTVITSSVKARSQDRCQFNVYLCDSSSSEHDDFMKSVIQRKLMVPPSHQQQMSNVIQRQWSWMKENNKIVNISSQIDLGNLHILNNLITKINANPFKDQNLTDTVLLEFQRQVLDRIIYPDNRLQALNNLLRLLKEEVQTQESQISSEQADNLILFYNGSKLLNRTDELQEFIGNFNNCILKQMSSLYQNLKKQNYHQVYISLPGSRIIDGVKSVADKLKYQILSPDVSKFKDAFSFVDQINQMLVATVKNQKKTVILIQDSYINDLGYVDYILNLIHAIKESTQNCSLSYFNSLDQTLNYNLRQMLIDSARDLHNQQISHSPHSGISSPASPSSLTTSITDTQLLMNALSKLAPNMHFILSIQSLSNYHNYTKVYPHLETSFSVSYISEEAHKDNSNQVLADVQKWIHDFSLQQVYESNFDMQIKRSEHAFNGLVNRVVIREGKDVNILKDGLFDTIDYQRVNSELNLSIPYEYTLSNQRFELFKQLYQAIKQFLYKSLANQKQFFQRYFDQYQTLQQDYMRKILSKDAPQITKNHLLAFNLLGIQEKIDIINSQLKTKEQLLKQKEKEREDLSRSLEQLKDELSQQKQQSENKIQQLITRIRQVQPQEFKNLSSAISNGHMNDSDMEIIQGLQGVIQIKKGQFLKEPEVFVDKLLEVSHQGVPEQIQNKYLRQLQKKLQSYSEQDKSLYSLILRFLNELSKKTQTMKKLQHFEIQANGLKEQVSLIQGQIQLYGHQMAEMREEVEDLMIKEKNMKSELRDILRRLDMKELKNLRNDHKLKSILKQGKKSEQRLDKVKIRMKNLEGDCIILASSIAYLGAFSLSERMEIRKQMAEKLLLQRNIEASEYWQNTQGEQVHCKYFKKIIQNDLGLKSEIFSKLNHLFIDSLFSEFMFTYIFSPTTPVIYDSVGNYQQYLTEEILDEIDKFKVKVVFSSDYMIQEKIKLGLDNAGQKANQLLFLNDVCDHSKGIQGKSQDQSILHRLSQQQYHAKISSMFSDNPTVQLPVLTLFSANQHFNLNSDYLATATIFNATFVNKNEAWIEIKQILLKHFLPDNYQKLSMIKQQIQQLRQKLIEKQKAFEQLFMKVKSQQVEDKDHKALEEIRQCYLDMKQIDEDYQQYNQAFHNLINEHPLLASYSNIFVILYYALKELTKFTEEITYSWKIYTKVIDMIIAKIIRDLTMNLKNKENEESDGEDDQDGQMSGGDMMRPEKKKKKKDKEFTIDEEFFHSVIMPSIYSTIVAGIKQEHVSLFNLLFSLEIALKKTTVQQEDKDFFVSKFFKIKNCYDWRLNPHKPSTIVTGFAEPNQRIKQSEYMNIKRDILKIYPDLRKLFETIEIKIGKEFTYKEANALIYQKLFKNNGEGQQWKDLPLIKKLNVGFICPDDEWRSKVCQFVYEELTTIFDFTEDLNKLHNFIKTASWSLPIALFTSNSINIVNTVCSIASYYGVGLEVLRTDYQQSIKKHERYYQNKEVNDNLKSSQQELCPDKPLSNEAACVHYEQIDPTKEDRVQMQKQNYQKMFVKDELEIDDKQITQNQSSIQLIEKCAENGTWVLISTLKFPSFWYKISRRLEKMSKKGKVLNTFRLFFDLQGYSLQEIPESFLFNHSVKFYLTEKNNEDMEGFNDVWANILNDDLLNAKDLHNVPVLEPPSDIIKINLNLESNMYESSMDSLLPPAVHGNQTKAKDQINPATQKKTVKDDKITYSMSQYQSKDSIVLPQIFTTEHMREIMMGGHDLMSPREGSKPKNQLQKGHMPRKSDIDDISEISMGNHPFTSGLMSGQQSILLMDDMSKMEGAFLSELNQAFAKKMSSTQQDEENQKQHQHHQQQNQQKYEMIKKPAPTTKRGQPPQKH